MARSKRGRVLALFAALTLVMLAYVAAAEATQMRVSEAAAEAEKAPEKAEAVDLEGDAVEEVVDATMSAALSGCGLCQQTGYCDRAFRNTPGQFCLSMESGAPCCCPLGAQCAASPFDCRCRRVASNSYPNSQPYPAHSTSSSSGSSFSTVLFILLVLCCICCCWLPAHKRHREREESVHYAQPVHVDTHYGTGQQPVYGYPGYPSAPVYEADNRRGGSDALAAGAAGAVGGLGIGALLGSMLGGRGGGDNGHSDNSSSYFAGDTGGSSSYFGGDSGGYGGNVSQSTYTFSGDTGGNGGGGDTFSGDS